MFNSVTQGEQATRRVLVRGQAPFKIVAIQCDDDQCFAFSTDHEEKSSHIVEIKFDAKKSAGDVKQPIHITTDLGNKLQATVTAYGTIVPSETQPTATDTKVAKPAADAGSAATTDSAAGSVARQ